LSLRPGDEGEPTTVGREEGCGASFGSRDGPRVLGVQGAQPQLRRRAGLDGVRDRRAVGRDRECGRVLVFQGEPLAHGRDPLEAQRRPEGPASQQREGREREGRHGDRPGHATSGSRRLGLARGLALVGGGALVHQEPRVGDGVQAVPRIALEAAAQQAAHAGRSDGGQGREVDLALEYSGEDVAHRLAGEELAAREHLVEHDAEGPDVRALVDRLAPGLLGRHVRGRAEDQAGGRAGVREGGGLREVGAGARHRVDHVRLGEPEVENLDLAVRRQLDVGRLEVAVDDAALVSLLERLGDLPRDRSGLVERDRSALQPLREVLALHQLHGEEVGGRAVGERRGLEAVDVCDVRVVERGEKPGFALEAGEALRVLPQLRRQHLDRDLALELRVGGAIHLAHAARAQRAGDLVGAQALSGRQAHGVLCITARRGRTNNQ
jgi:DNA-binding TFAR19-related protein (PDSD5 family)